MSMFKLYEHMLETAWSGVDDNGHVYTKRYSEDGTTVKYPMQIEKKNVLMPTQQNLSNMNPETEIAFHPLNENPIKGESAVLAKLRHAIATRINYSTMTILTGLLSLANNKEAHRKLSPEQSELLSVLKDVSDTTVESFVRLVTASLPNGLQNAFVKFYLRRGGKLNDVTYSRCSMVSFPFYEDLVAGKDSRIYKKDTAVLLKLFEFMFPRIATAEAYSVGSDSQVAPYTDAFFRSLIELIGSINNMVDMYGDFLEDKDRLKIEAEWAEELPHLQEMVKEIRMIPRQVGSDGSEKRSDVVATQNAITPATTPVARSPAMAPQQNTQLVVGTQVHNPQPLQQQPQKVGGLKVLSYEEMLAQRNNPQPLQQTFQPRQPVVVNTAWQNAPQFSPVNRDGSPRASNNMLTGGAVGGMNSFNRGAPAINANGGFRNHMGGSI
jgi:hypothetical protein